MPRPKKDEYRQKFIIDPVHGDIGLSQLELDLINSLSFQRLRRLKQLGLATLVYPSATHSRFAHSLGVFHVMSRAIDLMYRRKQFSNKERRLLRISALLHDIGHYPYSHLVEKLDLDPYREKLLGGSRGSRTHKSYPDHEKLGALIIMNRSDITEPLSKAKIDPEDIASIIRGQHGKAIYNRLIHSTLDLDRMDYLVRDSLATRVPFGRIDLNYLLSNLDLDQHGNLVLHKKAATAVEHFVVARYFMSKAVYLHKTVFAFEALMRQALFLLRRAGDLWKNGSEIQRLALHKTKFLTFHDGAIDSIVEMEAAKPGLKSPLGRLCRAIRDRKPPKLLAEVSSLTSHEGEPSEALTRFIVRRKDQIAAAARECDIPIECWLLEDPKSVGFEKLSPLMRLSEAETATPESSAELIHLLGIDGQTTKLVEDKSSILYHLSNMQLQIARLYVVEEDEGKIAKAKRTVNKWIRG